MKNTYLCLLASALGLFTACSKSEDTPAPAATTNLVATIDGYQQVLANSSTATGAFAGVYTSSTRQLTYTVTFQGVTPNNAHIHTGAPGVNGAVAIPFATLASPITGSVTLTPEQADNLLNNRMYVNIHSNAYPNGEIRGDIHKQ
jgi:hypothetical protein